jgi:hypothetical protein
MDGCNLLDRQFTRQHHLRETHVLQKAGFLSRADIGLRAGMQLDGRQIQFQQAHVLHDQHISACVVDVPGHLACALQFVVAQDGVQGDEDAAVEAVRVATQLLNLANVIARRCPCTKAWATDVNSICPVVDGLDTDVGIARRA